MKRFVLILVYMSIVNAFVFAQNQWTQKATMFNYGRYAAISLTINGKAYVGLGEIFNGTKVYDFWEYDPITNIWTKKADYPGGGSYAATAFSINGKGYICLGADNSTICQNDLWEYNPDNNTWTQKANFPGRARYGASSFVIENDAYVGTGSYNNGNDYLFDMWKYSPHTDSWSQIANFPGGKRSHATAFSIGNYGYLGTGLSDSYTTTSDFWRYDRVTNSWNNIPNLPGLPRMGVASFVIENKAYVGMGYDTSNNYNDFYLYYPTSNTWGKHINASNDLLSRRAAVSFSINKIGYVATGYADNGILSDLWSFSSQHCDESDNDINVKSAEEVSGVSNIINSSLGINVYPNPATEVLNIETSMVEKEATLIIYNINGQELINQQIIENKVHIDISKLKKGIYFIKLITTNSAEVKKFIKK